MTVDARRRKNQKKKLRQKEKKAAADKPTAEESIGEEEELDMAVSEADPLVVDRVAAEEVIPHHYVKEGNEEVISQDDRDRMGSPQIVPEPMGQAIEPMSDLEYEEHSPYQRFDDDEDRGQSLRYSDSSSNNGNEEAIEECSYLPVGHTQGQKHRRSASAAAAAAAHLSEDASPTDVLLEGSIERRVSLQMKRQSLSSVKPDVAPEEPSQEDSNLFKSYDYQQHQSKSDQHPREQSGFPFPSKRVTQEESLSPNQVPQDQREPAVKEQTTSVQNQETQDQEATETNQQESLNAVEANDEESMDGENQDSQDNDSKGFLPVGGQETNRSNSLKLGADTEEEGTQNLTFLPPEQAEQATAMKASDENGVTVQSQIPVEENNKAVDNNSRVDELFGGDNDQEDHEPMPWESSQSAEGGPNVDDSSFETLKKQELDHIPRPESSTIDQPKLQKESEKGEEFSSYGESVNKSQPNGTEKIEDNLSLKPNQNLMHAEVSTTEPVQSSNAVSLPPSTDVTEESLTSTDREPLKADTQDLFEESGADQQEPMPWETSQPTEPTPEPSSAFSGPVISQDIQTTRQQEDVEAPEPSNQQEVDMLFNIPGDERRDPMPWEASENDADVMKENVAKGGHEKRVQENTVTQLPHENSGQVDELFGESNGNWETLPWETAEPGLQSTKIEDKAEKGDGNLNAEELDAQKPTANEAQVDNLFGESEHEPMPWEAAEAPAQAPVDSTEKNPGPDNHPNTVEPRKFSFLENDDDLLDDDDDSYLESDEEDENSNHQVVHTVESELSKSDQRSIGQAQTQPVSAAASSLNSPTLSRGAVSKYQPTNVPQAHPQHIHRRSFQAGVPPQVMGGPATTGIVPPQPQVSSGFVAQQRNAVDGQKVAQKINEEKKKSDAFDLPMDLVSKRTEKVPAKPVGVPSSRISSPPPFEVGTQAPPISSRKNSVASLPNNPYAAVANTSKGKVQSPLPPQGVVLPQNALPLGNQLPPSQAVPFPASRKQSTRSQYAPTIRTRGFSNVSTGGPISAGTTGSHLPSFAASPPQGPVAPASKYALTSPLKAAAYPPTGLTAPIGGRPAGIPPVNVGAPVGGPSPNTGKSVPVSSNFPNTVSNVPPPSSRNIPVAQAQPAVAQNLSVPPYGDSVPTTNTNASSEASPPTGISTSTGPPLSGRGKKTASRAYARSNSSVYAPNQNEHTSKYAPTVHPQYQNLSPPTGPVAAPNPLSSINAYMTASQPQVPRGPGPLSVSKPVDSEALLQHQFPLFSWSASEKLVYGVPDDNGQNAYLLGSSMSVRDFNLVNVDSVLNSKNFLKSFPGPLVKNKTRRKDLQKWLEDHFDEFSRYENDLNSTVLSVLKLNLTDNVNFKDISRVLYNSDELYLYLSQPVMQPRQMPYSNKLDANNQTRISAYLQTGGQEEALRLALDMKDFSMALLIGSLMGKEKWSEVVKNYLASEIEVASGDSMSLTNLLSLIFQVFVGSSKTAFQEFYINEVKGKWALENWRMVVAAVLNNVNCGDRSSISEIHEVPPVVVEFLVEYGVFLSRKGLQLPACILFMIANLPLSPNPIATDIDVKFEFVGSPYSLEGMIFSEIYEFCVADFKVFPTLLPQKLHHAACLHERGLTTAASKYTDYLSGILRTLPKKEAFSINLTNQLNNLTACIAGTSTGWLGKPKLSSVWGHLDKSFNKFIGGDDDSLMKKSSGKKVFDGFTPVSSRNNSTLDLSKTPFVPYQGHSKKPSFGNSDTGISSQSVGPSPIRNPIPSEDVYGGKIQPDPHPLRPPAFSNNYQGSPKVSQYVPSRTSSAGTAPPNLRSVHTQQTLGGLSPQSSAASSEALNNTPAFQRELRPPNGKIQETQTSVFSQNERPLMKKTQHYSSTPNLLRRYSGLSDGSSVRKENLGVTKKLADVPLLGEHLKEASEETGFSPDMIARSSNRRSADDGRQPLVERPHLGAPPLLHSQESSPVSTVATESATEDDDLNSDNERTFLRSDQPSWVAAPAKVSSSITSNPAAMVQKGSGETLKKPEGKQLPQVSTDVLPTASDSADDKTPLAPTKNEAGLGIQMEPSESNSAIENKVDPPPILSANPYASSSPVRKASSSRKSYLPKSMPQGPALAAGTHGDSKADVNGLAMFVEESETSKQVHETEPVSIFPLPEADVSSSNLKYRDSPSDRTDPSSRFDPVKEPEKITAETFEPVIKKTPDIRTFSPMVVQPPENQYDDVVEDESEDEDEEESKRRKEEEEQKAKEEEEEERRERERAEKAKRDRESREKSSSGSGWFSWLKKDTNEKKPIKAKLGNKKRNFYYDDKLKRWVNNNATEEEKEKFSTPPPPPPVVRRMDNGPKTKPRSGSQTAAPKPSIGAVTPKNPITGDTLTSPALSATTSQSSSEKSSTAPPPSSSNSGVNLAGKKANGLDDLLNLAGGNGASTRRKKKSGRGYVNVMETK